MLLLELTGRVSHRAYVRVVVRVSLLDRRPWVAAGEPLGLDLSEIDLLTRCIAALVGNKAAQAPARVRSNTCELPLVVFPSQMVKRSRYGKSATHSGHSTASSLLVFRLPAR